MSGFASNGIYQTSSNSTLAHGDAEIDDVDMNKNNLEKEMECKTNKIIYPPENGKVIKKMTSYLLGHKRVTYPLPGSVKQVANYCKEYVPAETECVYCKEPLTEPILVTSRGKVVTMQCVKDDISIFIKMCP